MQLHNKNIEKGILSSIFYNPSLMDNISFDLINDEYFYDSNHKKIYSAMLSLYKNNEPIDEEFIKKNLSSDTKFNESSITEILSISPLVDIDGYVKELKELGFRRNIVTLSSKIFKIAKDNEQDRNLIEEYVQQNLFKIMSQDSSKEYDEAKDAIDKTIDYMKILKERGNKILTGVDTGFNTLNKQTTGFNKGDLIIVAARPAMGKTAIALNMVLKNIENNTGVAIFSLEMPTEQLMLRLLSIKTSIPLQNLRIGNVDDDEWSRISDAMSEFEDKTLIIDDNSTTNINILKTKIRKLKIQFPNIELIVIDYLQLIDGANNRDRHLEVSEISRGLKNIAREVQVPVIALAQLNRELEKRVNKRPMISDLRESGSIEQDADIVMFVHREDVYKSIEEQKKKKENDAKGQYTPPSQIEAEKNEVEAELIIGKQRNGPIGTIHLKFIKNLTKFMEPLPQVTNYEGQSETKLDNIDMDGVMN